MVILKKVHTYSMDCQQINRSIGQQLVEVIYKQSGMKQNEEQEQHFINIKIKTLNHSLYDIIANPQKPIRAFQNQILQKTAVPVESQRLLYRGVVVDVEKTLMDYRIEEGNIIQLVANKIPSQHSHHSSLKRSEINKANSYSKEHNKTKKYRQLQERLNGFRMKKEQSLEVLQQNKHTIDQLIQCLNHNFLQDVAPFKIERRKLEVGEWIDIRDASGQWLEGQVVNQYGQYVFVHYNGLHNRWNEWISVSSERIMPFRTHTVQLLNKTSYLSPFPSYQRQISSKTNTNFQTNIQTFVYELTNTLDNISSLMKELEFTRKDLENDQSLKNVSHLEPPQLQIHAVHLQHENQHEEMSEVEPKQYFETPNKDSVIIGDNISNKCEDDRSNKCDNDDVSSKKSYKSKRSEGLVDTASMKSLTIDQSRKRQNKVFFDRAEEAQSVRSVCPKKQSKNINTFNQQFIPEEDSQFNEQDFQEAGRIHKKQLKRKMKASQLAPLLDRMGRLLIDIAPHFAMLGHTDQLISSSLNENLSTYTNEGSLLSKLSQLNKCAPTNHQFVHSSQAINIGKPQAVDENNEEDRVINSFCSFQIPVMLNPNELLKLQRLIEAEKKNLHML